MSRFTKFVQNEAQNVKNLFKNGDYISEWSNITDQITKKILKYVGQNNSLTDNQVLIFFKLFVYFRFISKFLRYPKDHFNKIINSKVVSLREEYINNFNEKYKPKSNIYEKYKTAYNDVVGFLKGDCFINLLQPLSPTQDYVAANPDKPPEKPLPTDPVPKISPPPKPKISINHNSVIPTSNNIPTNNFVTNQVQIIEDRIKQKNKP